MNDSNLERVPEPVAEVVRRLLDGWRPSCPVLGSPTRFVWADRDLSPDARAVAIEGGMLRVSLSIDSVLPEAPELWNKPFVAALDVGATIRADIAHPDGNGAAARYWSWSRADETPRVWVGAVHGLTLHSSGNVVVRRPAAPAGDMRSPFESRRHHRFESLYTYYLVQVSTDPEAQEWYLVIDTGARGAPIREVVYPDMLAMQFVLGRALQFDLLHGLDHDLAVVALVGGTHGRDHGSRGENHPPVPFDELTSEHWPALLFTALSRTYRERPELRFYIPLAFYLDALAGFHVENKSLVLHVALEGLAYWFLGGDVRDEPPLVDKPKWKAWLKEHQGEIEGLAVEGRGQALFAKVASVGKRRASTRVVEDAFAAQYVRLTLLPQMVHELQADEGRGLLVHAAVMFKESQADLDAYRGRIALLRTMIVALLGRIVGYDAAIVGWRREPMGPYRQPDASWWPVSAAARSAARHRYVIERV